MDKFLKWLLIVIGVIVAGFMVLFIVVMAAFGAFDKTYTKQDLIENYLEKEKEIQELKAYFNEIVPKGKEVHLELDGSEMAIFHVTTYDSITGSKGYDSNWNLEKGSVKADMLLMSLGWTKNTINTLRQKLDDANCISVDNSKPFTVGFQRSGMGMYFYKIFDEPLPDSLKNQYNDSCTYMIYTDKVVLEYGGGAVGPQCFPWDKES